YIIYMKLYYGNVPDFSMFLKYQKIYYIHGFSMAPMKVIHMWNMVILIYIAGLSYGIKAMFDRNTDINVKSIVFLSILGLGIFSYFQGRSYDSNLLVVCYPALLILTIFTDKLLSQKGLYRFIAMIILPFFIFSTIMLLSKSFTFYNHITNKFVIMCRQEDNKVLINGKFILAHTHPGEKVLILSYHSGIYYNMSGTLCPLKIGHFTELYYKDDYRKISDFLKENKEVKIFLDNTFLNEKNILLILPGNSPVLVDITNILIKDYKQVDMSSDGYMIMLKKL
ncbi:MAG: hypothetical protein ABRQ39_08365, partial [Candidatus Eremiobacterota bacterium]